MNLLDRVIAAVSPQVGLRRAQARAALMHYDAAAVVDRTAHWRRRTSDANAAGAQRGRLAQTARDMLRNNAWAERGVSVIVNNTIGDGIIPRLRFGGRQRDAERAAERGLGVIETLFDTVSIDADGRQNLYGLQRTVMRAVVADGEALVVRVSDAPGTGGEPRLRIRVLEADYIDTAKAGASAADHFVVDGIEYDAAGRRFGYWLFEVHPGADMPLGSRRLRAVSRLVPAQDVVHVYRPDRPEQMRGVSWLAPVTLRLMDLADYDDAELTRHKVASCFAAFRRSPTGPTAARAAELEEIRPGTVMDIVSDEDLQFAQPPQAGDFDPFVRAQLRAVAAGLGITYEALTGDLSQVNFSSARLGRMEMERNVTAWQWTMLVPQMLQPLGRWLREAWIKAEPGRVSALRQMAVEWVPPHRVLVDPAREIGALRDMIRAGLASRPGVVRQLGYDPERLDQEIAEDAAKTDRLGLRFESDYRHAGARAAEPAAAGLAGDASGGTGQDGEGNGNA